MVEDAVDGMFDGISFIVINEALEEEEEEEVEEEEDELLVEGVRDSRLDREEEEEEEVEELRRSECE